MIRLGSGGLGSVASGAAGGGLKSTQTEKGLVIAHKFLNESRSADALNWLRLGLMAHHQLPEDYCPPADVGSETRR